MQPGNGAPIVPGGDQLLIPVAAQSDFNAKRINLNRGPRTGKH